MTIVAVWREADALWCVADTRISRPMEKGSVNVTTDAGGKLFPLRITCRKEAFFQHGVLFMNRPHHDQKVGVAFAGNVTAATQTITTMVLVCQELHTEKDDQIPALCDVAFLLSRVSAQYAAHVRSATLDLSTRNLFSFVIFGFCPVAQELQAWMIEEEVKDEQTTVSVKRCSTSSETDVIVLGSQQARFRELLTEFRSNGRDEFDRSTRWPKLVVEKMVLESRGDVGGSVSIGLATKDGFENRWTSAPDVPGQPRGRRLLNGIDVDEIIGRIGPARVGGFGQA
ncbi:hypothetical protein F4V91_15285 [Neorhizobium galegae]|uniref:Uncharacterized protein n=1 Tax=Neorhizobium galegae TaxID=399 RepID=A0A6A1TS36_NEOGA|nr:hypothetical protein [Neorhizobium galegae]KAB1087671.1 hypothetical protein F4V91_15285 [Neorhizobium galegae]